VAELTDYFPLTNSNSETAAVKVKKHRDKISASKNNSVLRNIDVDALPLPVELPTTRQAPTSALRNETVVARKSARNNSDHEATDVVCFTLVLNSDSPLVHARPESMRCVNSDPTDA